MSCSQSVLASLFALGAQTKTYTTCWLHWLRRESLLTCMYIYMYISVFQV